MQLEVHVGMAMLTTLVDLGSTYNFVCKAAREQLGLAMQPWQTGRDWIAAVLLGTSPSTSRVKPSSSIVTRFH